MQSAIQTSRSHKIQIRDDDDDCAEEGDARWLSSDTCGRRDDEEVYPINTFYLNILFSKTLFIHWDRIKEQNCLKSAVERLAAGGGQECGVVTPAAHFTFTNIVTRGGNKTSR